MLNNGDGLFICKELIEEKHNLMHSYEYNQLIKYLLLGFCTYELKDGGHMIKVSNIGYTSITEKTALAMKKSYYENY